MMGACDPILDPRDPSRLHKRRERLQGAELAAFTAKKLKVAAAEKRRLELVAQEEAMGDDDEADGMGDSDDDDDSNTLLQVRVWLL